MNIVSLRVSLKNEQINLKPTLYARFRHIPPQPLYYSKLYPSSPRRLKMCSLIFSISRNV